MNDPHVHVDIHFKHRAEPYELLDNHPCYVFSPTLFLECFEDFENCNGEMVRKIEPDNIKQRLKCLKTEIEMYPGDEEKINKAIKYIEKHYEQYLGITTIYRVD